MSKVLLLSHYYHCDDVSASLQFSSLAEGLSPKGYEAEVWPSNRSYDHENQSYSCKPEFVKGVLIRRVWRPRFNEHRFFGRILNSIWLEKIWGWRALFSKAPDIIIIGTDPIFAFLLTPLLKFRWPKTKIVHWCFDLYPEYAVAEGLISKRNPIVRFLRFMAKKSYAACDLVVNLGPCMANRLRVYSMKKTVTLTPWALEEPSEPLAFDKAERESLFGESKLGLLYSGNLSHPHEFYLTLKLARKMRDTAIFAYSARGSRLDDLKKAWNPEDANFKFVDFAPLDKLEARLSAPDIHLVSLKDAYTGVAVPFKFFGALAAGRPILFEGSPDSAIARWIEEYKIGWVLTVENLSEIASDLAAFAKSPKKKREMFDHCHQIYLGHFSKKAVMEEWDSQLRLLLT
jgi:glycosyltransferase involved in cell wall biosynthesis